MANLWIITEGMAGTENQCLGVAEALGMAPSVMRVTLRSPWKQLSPWLAYEQAWSFVPPLHGPWPDILVTSGRKAIAAARYIKSQNPATFTVHIQDPHISPDQFDLVAVPHHDRLRGKNVIVTDAAPNRITDKKLSLAAPPSPSPKQSVGVLIGGNSKTHTMTDRVMDTLIAHLTSLAGAYKLLVTVSRRTSAAQTQKLTAALQNTDAYIWDGTGENPYFGILAQADFLLVTNDSTSMIADAATTGKPVYLIPLEGGSAKFARLYDHLRDLGAVRDFTGILESYTYPPLRDAQKIAENIRKASGLF